MVGPEGDPFVEIGAQAQDLLPAGALGRQLHRHEGRVLDLDPALLGRCHEPVAAVLGALWCVRRIPLDAIPDLSDTQVIVYSRWDRSPDIIEDQVTYPIASALLGAPRIKAVPLEKGWPLVQDPKRIDEYVQLFKS